jgi:hypothetical protein
VAKGKVSTGNVVSGRVIKDKTILVIMVKGGMGKIKLVNGGGEWSNAEVTRQGQGFQSQSSKIS